MLGNVSPRAIRSAVATLLDAVVFDDVTTTYSSDAQSVKPYRHFALYLDIDSTATPATIRFVPEFSPDGGTTWHEYRQGLFAALYYEDVDTASGLQVCFSGECAGRTFRLRVVATGTTAANKFTVTAQAEFWT
jgi:hypothetical protein